MSHDYRDVLLKAASIVEEGWCQGHSWEGDGLVDISWVQVLHLRKGGKPVKSCMLGAVTLAVHDLTGLDVLASTSPPAVDAREALDAALPVVASQWNDMPWRTKEEVADKLREVASA